MTIIIVSIVAAWILFSALLVTVICMNSSRLSRIDEPFKDPAEIAQMRRERREEYANSSRLSRIDDPMKAYEMKIKEWADAYDKSSTPMTQAEFDELYKDYWEDK